jgi:hypothetical protein
MCPRAIAHLLEQVESDRSPRRSDGSRRQDRVDARTASDVKDGLAGLKSGVADRVSNSERPVDSGGR